jgi:hypothetical protein
MSIVQLAAVAIFGANLVGYILYWMDGNQLAMIDKLLWMVLMTVIFSTEVLGYMMTTIKGGDDEDHRAH